MGLKRAAIPVVGLGMAAAGLDKMAGGRSYQRLYRHWGWSERAMQRAGTAEFVGGLFMVPRGTRRLGGLIMAGASVLQLAAEIRSRDDGLAAARVGVLAAALAAVIRG